MRFLRRLYSYLYFKSWSLGFWTPPDRQFLTQEIFGYFRERADIRKVLFVGVHRYTKDYQRFFKRQVFQTIDRDPSQKIFGASRHETADVREIKLGQFDLIILNGVIGFGLNDVPAIRQAVSSLRHSLSMNGWLVLGTNPQTFTPEIENEFAKEFSFGLFGKTGQSLHSFRFPFLRDARHEFRFLQPSKGI